MQAELREAIARRIEKFQAELRVRGWHAAWLGQSTNLRYFSGVVEHPSERLFGAWIPAEGEPFMLVPRLYHDEMQSLSAISTVVSWNDEEGMDAAVHSHLAMPAGSTIALDPQLQARFVFLFREQLAKVQFTSAGPLIEQLRLRKDSYEQACLQRAAEIADAVMAEITAGPLIGRSERDVAADIVRSFEEHGSEGVSFSPISSAGANAAHPHHGPDGSIIKPGDCLVLDFGGVHQGYASDITRTVFAGQPEQRMRHIYETVRLAQQHAVENLRPGITAAQADALARDYIAEAGFGGRFLHRLGHGIGLDVHEPPYIVGGSNQVLEPGVAFSVEPGIYVTGLGGVRIEDIVLMGEAGVERLNHAPRELTVAA
ncbi:MAG: aminopeptidase P family protein [Chloroflexi bacterium]|nr:aminopeptidase P family protein [Chloroflexota bacterium]